MISAVDTFIAINLATVLVKTRTINVTVWLAVKIWQFNYGITWEIKMAVSISAGSLIKQPEAIVCEKSVPKAIGLFH